MWRAFEVFGGLPRCLEGDKLEADKLEVRGRLSRPFELSCVRSLEADQLELVLSVCRVCLSCPSFEAFQSLSCVSLSSACLVCLFRALVLCVSFERLSCVSLSSACLVCLFRALVLCA